MPENNEAIISDPIQRILDSAGKAKPQTRDMQGNKEHIRQDTDKVKKGMEMLTEHMESVMDGIKEGNIPLGEAANIIKGRDSIDIVDQNAVLSDSSHGLVRYKHTFRGRDEYRHDLQSFAPVAERSNAAGNRLFVYTHMDDATRTQIASTEKSTEQAFSTWTEYYIVGDELKKYAVFPKTVTDPLHRENVYQRKSASLQAVPSEIGHGDWELVQTVLKTLQGKVEVAQQQKKPL